MIRVSFLLIAIPLLLGIFYLVKKALQQYEDHANLVKVKVTRDRYNLVKDLNTEEYRKQQAELIRIQKELE